MQHAATATVVLGVASIILCSPSHARAAPLLEIPSYEPAWESFDWLDYSLIGASLLAAGTATLAADSIDPFRGSSGFDTSVRRHLRLPQENQRLAARDASDALVATLLAYPLVVDSLILSTGRYQRPDVGLRMALITAEVYAVTFGLTFAIKNLVRRERPYGHLCGTRLTGDTRACDSNARYQSFPSGHASSAFAAATAICVHHAYVPLTGDGFVGALPCAAGLTLATATGVLRMVGDRHYATDVFAGAALGAAAGFLVPWLLHYRNDNEKRGPLTDTLLLPTTNGLYLVRVF